MKKFAKVILVIVVIAVIAVTAIRFIAPSLFFGYMYPFNRIKGNISISIDGKDIPLSDCEISCRKDNDTEKVRVNGSKIKNRAGQYGKYCYNIIHGDTEIRYYVFQYNCWNCANYNISFDVDTAKRTVSCKGYCKSLNENGMRDTFETNTTRTLVYDQFDDGICILSP